MNSRSLPKGAPQPGAVFAEKYKVERVLGIGGMGYVFAATHLHLQEPVAIKMLLPKSVEDRTVIERFLREGRAAVKIRSEHVVRVLDVDELPDHTPYMVMEYLEGVDLSELLRREIRLEPPRAVGYVLQALEAVAKAHALRMVHRDLKPSNLFLTKTDDGADCVKVLDFGISKVVLHDADLAITKTTDALGTPLYMSPEQLKNSRTVDERADIWALGVVLFELISGQPPFFAESFAELGALVLSGNAPSLLERAPHVDPGLAEIVATCLRLDVAERFVNAADLADALVPFGGADARARADRIVRSVGMPATRAKRSSLLTATVPHVAAPAVSIPPAIAQVTAPLPPIEPSRPMLAPARTTLSSSLERRAEEQNPRSGTRAWIAIPLVLLLLAAGGAFAYRQRQRGGETSPIVAVSAPESSASTPSEAPTSGASPAPTPAASENVPFPATSSPTSAIASAAVDAGRSAAPAKTAGVRVPVASARLATSASAPSAPSPPSPKKNCNPDHFIDADGTKRWKPECF